MHRIDSATAEADTHGAGKDGFTDGTPPSIPPTDLTAKWFNATQEEICNIIEGFGVALDDAQRDQVYTILKGIGQLSLYGDGRDGASSPSSGTTTLADDKLFTNYTPSGTAKIAAAGYRIHVSGTLDLTNAPADAISNAGGAGAAGSPGTHLGGTSAAEITVGGSAQAAGDGAADPGSGNAGIQAAAVVAAQGAGGASGAGGAGGTDDGAHAGGTARAGVSPPTNVTMRRPTVDLLRGSTVIRGGQSAPGGSSGGGSTSGGGSGGGTGGGGGAGGGVVAVFAKKVVVATSTAAGCISANGGAGGAGTTTSAYVGQSGGGGGGGGAGGGFVFIVCDEISGTKANAVYADGGAGGAGGTSWGSGSGGRGGTGGTGGRIVVIKRSTATTTETTGSAGSAGSANSGATGGAGGAGGQCRATL